MQADIYLSKWCEDQGRQPWREKDAVMFIFCMSVLYELDVVFIFLERRHIVNEFYSSFHSRYQFYSVEEIIIITSVILLSL